MARLRLIPVAVEFLKENFGAKLRVAQDALDDAEISEKTFHKFCFDPVYVFGGDAVVRRILAPRGKASDRFWVEE